MEKSWPASASSFRNQIIVILLFAAAVLPGARGQTPGLKFDQGIGFYYYAANKMEMLGAAVPRKEWGSPFRTLMLPAETRFFVYGLDFSKGPKGTPLTPTQLGYAFTYVLPDGRINNRSWPARFLPLAGYPEKAYEIVFDGPLDSLKSGELDYSYCIFRLGAVQSAKGEEEAFCFKFIRPAAD